MLHSLLRSSPPVAIQMVVPEHTRHALFSLFVGLRAENSPKDADFFKIHAEALQPRSFLGWLVGLSARCCLLFTNANESKNCC